MSRHIVSRVAGDHYRNLQRRTYNQCRCFCPDDTLQFDTVPAWTYEEKLKALRLAQENGARLALWMDVSFEPVAPIEPIWDDIAMRGWFIPRQGDARLSEWVSDAALQVYGIDRVAAQQIRLCFSGIVGLDLESEIGRTILNRWDYLSSTFAGAHANLPGQPLKPWGNKFTGHVSNDPSVAGHRHDEAALSFVAWRLGLQIECCPLIAQDYQSGYIIGRNVQRENGTYAY